MPGGADVEQLVVLAKILLINIALSGDNAILIGMAGKHLPKDQQAKAIWWGAVGAVLLRIVLTGGVALLLRVPLIQMIGAVFLFYIAVKLLGHDGPREPARRADSLASAIRLVIAADFVMSLDNVLAVGGAAHGDIVLVILGLGMSIPLLMWGSTWISRLMNRFHSLVIVGGGILAYTATDMCLEDPYVWNALNPLLLNHAWLPLLVAVAVMALGRFGKT